MRTTKPSFHAILIAAFLIGGALASLADQFIFVGGVSSPVALARSLAGPVTHVRDGDTIEVQGVAVRLEGLHAPELAEARGREAKRFMERQVLGRALRCELSGARSYDRTVGVCFADGQDIADALVSAGLGRDCPRYSGGRYRRLETAESRRLPLPGYCRR
ncbi:MAG: thermonuclease family protein [Dehalococcoidia bacterium]